MKSDDMASRNHTIGEMENQAELSFLYQYWYDYRAVAQAELAAMSTKNYARYMRDAEAVDTQRDKEAVGLVAWGCFLAPVCCLVLYVSAVLWSVP